LAARAAEAAPAKAAATNAAGTTPASAPALARRVPAYVLGRPALAYVDSIWATGDKRVAHAKLDSDLARWRMRGTMRIQAQPFSHAERPVE
jgi:hypothetical protein